MTNIAIRTFLELVDEEYGGNRHYLFETQVSTGKVRMGQAFMNALRGTPYYSELAGSIKDPFFKEGLTAVFDAIEYLTTKR